MFFVGNYKFGHTLLLIVQFVLFLCLLLLLELQQGVGYIALVKRIGIQVQAAEHTLVLTDWGVIRLFSTPMSRTPPAAQLGVRRFRHSVIAQNTR